MASNISQKWVHSSGLPVNFGSSNFGRFIDPLQHGGFGSTGCGITGGCGGTGLFVIDSLLIKTRISSSKSHDFIMSASRSVIVSCSCISRFKVSNTSSLCISDSRITVSFCLISSSITVRVKMFWISFAFLVTHALCDPRLAMSFCKFSLLLVESDSVSFSLDIFYINVYPSSRRHLLGMCEITPTFPSTQVQMLKFKPQPESVSMTS